MPKLKLTCQKKRKKRKKHALPDIDDEFDSSLATITMDDFSKSFNEDDFVDSSRALSPDSDDDAELLVGLYKKEKRRKKLKAGDLAWIRHNRRCSFWPSYIKSVSNNKLHAYFIGYNTFSKGDKAFHYNVNSKKVKSFHTEDYESIISEGKELNKKLDAANGIDEEAKGSLSAFNNAVQLAEYYISKYNSENFGTEAEIFEFFRSNGLSLLQKQYLANHDLSAHNQKPSNLNESKSTSNLSLSSATQVSSNENSPDRSLISGKALNEQNSLNIDFTSLSPSKPDIVKVVSEEPSYPALKISAKKRKRHSNLPTFNEKNAEIVEFILKGNCDRYLLDILHFKIYSKRMAAFNCKWDKESLIPKTKNMKIEESYLEDEQQLEAVCKYLQNFAATHARDMIGMVKQGDLVFQVLVPESIIYGIHKVRRRRLDRAAMMYQEGCHVPGRMDSSLLVPLTEEERLTMARKIKALKLDLNLQSGT